MKEALRDISNADLQGLNRQLERRQITQSQYWKEVEKIMVLSQYFYDELKRGHIYTRSEMEKLGSEKLPMLKEAMSNYNAELKKESREVLMQVNSDISGLLGFDINEANRKIYNSNFFGRKRMSEDSENIISGISTLYSQVFDDELLPNPKQTVPFIREKIEDARMQTDPIYQKIDSITRSLKILESICPECAQN